MVCGLAAAGVVARAAVGHYELRPGLAAEDPRVFVTALMNASRWGLAVEGRPALGEAFLASNLEVSPPAAIPLRGEFDEEYQLVVSYRSMWRAATGAPPGHRQYFVYVGRDVGQDWRVIGSGTGP
jgi:recombinational DNA repair protein RecT